MPSEESTDQTQRDWTVPLFLAVWAIALAAAAVVELYQKGAITGELENFGVLLVDPMFWPPVFGLGLGVVLAMMFYAERQRSDLRDDLDRKIQEGYMEIPEEVEQRIVDEHDSMWKGYKSFHERFMNDPEFREEVLEVVEEYESE